jgi:hypothetical protein
MFKGGWRTAIAHQVALLERDGTRVALAVLTSGGRGDAYGRETEEGIAARVLAGLPRRRLRNLSASSQEAPAGAGHT